MKKNLLWSIVGLLGVTLASCSGTDSADSAYVSVQLEDSQMWSLLDVANGEIVMNDEFFAPSSGVVNGSFFVESDNGKFDLYNLKDTKNKLNRSSFSTVTNFNPEGYAIVRVEDEPWQIISTDGTVVATLDKSLNVLSGFSNEGLAQIANKDGMVGYVNTKGETPIKPRYKVGTIFSDGIAFVLTKQEGDHNYFSAINPAGESVFTFSDAKYSEIGLYNEGHAFAVEGDHSVLLDKTGKKVMTVCQGTNIGNLSYSKGNIIYYDGQFYGVKSTEDKILIRAKYQRLKFQSDGKLIAVNNNGKYGVITVEDEIETPFDYDVLEYLAPGRYITKSGNVNVLIDSKGKEMCDKAFASYSNRSSSASENNLTSLISADNNKSLESELNHNSDMSASALSLMNLNDWISSASNEPTATDSSMFFETDESYRNNMMFSDDVPNPDENPYIWLSEQKVNPADVMNLSKYELRILRNAIYAIHGHKFKSADLTKHFSQFSWYVPLGDMSGTLSDLERENIDFIKAYE